MRALLFLLLSIGALHSALLLNHPTVGEPLEVLVEDGGNQSVRILSPDGTSWVRALQGGHLTHPVDQPGVWRVRHGDEEASVEVAPSGLDASAPDSGLPRPPSNDLFSTLSPFPAPLQAAAALTLVLVPALALGLLLYNQGARPGAPQSASLEKVRPGGRTLLSLRAGTIPLEDVDVVDPVGPDWTDEPVRLRADRLEAGAKLEAEYDYAGRPAPARATFLCEGRRAALETAGPRVEFSAQPTMFGAADSAEGSGAAPAPSAPPSRLLPRASDTPTPSPPAGSRPHPRSFEALAPSAASPPPLASPHEEASEDAPPRPPPARAPHRSPHLTGSRPPPPPPKRKLARKR